MKLTVSSKSPKTIKKDLLVLCLSQDEDLFELSNPDVAAAVKELRAGIAEKKVRRELLLRAPRGMAARWVLIASTELVRHLGDDESLRTIGGRAVKTARELNLGSIAFAAAGAGAVRTAALLVEGALLGSYSFDRYRSQAGTFQRDLVIEVLAPASSRALAQKVCREVVATAASVNRARDMVNEPGGVMYPAEMAKAARAIAKRSGLTCEIWDEKRLKREGCNGLLTVGAGSPDRPPRLIILRYRPSRVKKGSPHVALVGKGLTFDTGGISIKPANNMWMMKGDMGGGSAVLHAMEIVGRVKPRIPVTAVVPSSENYPGPNAQMPGDIFIARNGKSIHIDNTDAEGRLILTDGLYQAGKEGATHILDAATLTGSCVRALGTSIAGVMGTDADLVSRVISMGREQGENFWELPLHEEYRELLEFPIADVNNVGGANAGAITAGLFLKEFVPEGVAWAHLDIAGTFITEKPWKHFGPGATGFGVKTLAAVACDIGQ